jgi:hypothetical protein
MAKRPIFVPNSSERPFVKEITLEFEWFPGFAISQAQRSIRSFHKSAAKEGISPVLEISSKSTLESGVALSAFNLRLEISSGRFVSVESAFQGSKVFSNGGPYSELYDLPSREAKTDPRLRNSGNIVAFNLLGEQFPTEPLTAFYDWLYIRALAANPDLANQLLFYKGFSDIAFNPERSLNCQARSAALYVALHENNGGKMDRIASDKEYFLELLTGPKQETGTQLSFL